MITFIWFLLYFYYMEQRLELGHFAEFARMLKYIDRYDEQEIVSTIKQECEKEMQKAREQLVRVNEIIEETTGETVEPIGVEANVKEQQMQEESEQDSVLSQTV